MGKDNVSAMSRAWSHSSFLLVVVVVVLPLLSVMIQAADLNTVKLDGVKLIYSSASTLPGQTTGPSTVQFRFPDPADFEIPPFTPDVNVHIEASIKDNTTWLLKGARQVVLLAQHADGAPGDAHAFVLTSKSIGRYEGKLELSSYVKALLRAPGLFKLSLYVASPTIHPLNYELGTVAIDFDVDAKFINAEPEDLFEELPLITHIFHPAETMIHPSISVLYVGVIVALPWLLYAGLLKANGANIRNLYRSPTTTSVGGAFLGLLGVFLSFYFLYWVRLNLFRLLGYGGLLGSATVVVGRYALVDRAGFTAQGL